MIFPIFAVSLSSLSRGRGIPFALIPTVDDTWMTVLLKRRRTEGTPALGQCKRRPRKRLQVAEGHAVDHLAHGQSLCGHVEDREIRIDPLHASRRGQWIRSEERRVGKECRSRWSPYH